MMKPTLSQTIRDVQRELDRHAQKQQVPRIVWTGLDEPSHAFAERMKAVRKNWKGRILAPVPHPYAGPARNSGSTVPCEAVCATAPRSCESVSLWKRRPGQRQELVIRDGNHTADGREEDPHSRGARNHAFPERIGASSTRGKLLRRLAFLPSLR